ncbi:MAG: hypothetical protein KJ072_05925 [Verrucomicrobia bacterium]|nr:hypothetical protein [Verrucomicrobiota bacterium]
MDDESRKLCRAARFYRLLLFLYPAWVREKFGAEMLRLFKDQWREARSGRSTLQRLRFWLWLCADTGWSAGREHLSGTRRNMKNSTNEEKFMEAAQGNGGSRLWKRYSFGLIGVGLSAYGAYGIAAFASQNLFTRVRDWLFLGGTELVSFAGIRTFEMDATLLACLLCLTPVVSTLTGLALCISAIRMAQRCRLKS